MKALLTYCLFFLGFSGLLAQKIPEKGVPRLDNYTPSQYANHGKIWEMAAAPNGLLYMAGDGGLLEYDGLVWNPFKGSEGYMRSLLVANDSLIYSGSDLDFGVWKKNEYQQFEYTSLYPFHNDPNEESEEFWDVHQIGDKVVFVSFSNIYVYRKGQITKIAAPTRFSGSYKAGETIYLADEKNGLYVFNGISLKPVFAYPGELPLQISGVFPHSGGLLVVTRNKGLFRYQSGRLTPFTGEVSDALVQDQVFCSAMIRGGYLVFGTILNGLYITDLKGRIIQHINKQKGLPNNTILSIYDSPDGLLWLGMDYGISALHIFDGRTYFFDYNGLFGTAYAALLQNGTFYLGTNQGLYTTDWRQLDNKADANLFTLVKGSEGQVWSLANINGTIFCGHNRGLFTVEGNTIRQIHQEPGVWTILSYKNDYLLTGNYNGLLVFKKTGNAYSFVNKIPLIIGSCNQVLNEKDNIFWVNIPNFGLIRFALNDDFYPEDRMIFPASQFSGKAFYLRKDEDGIHLLTSEYQYLFDSRQKRFTRQQANASPANIPGLLAGTYESTPIDDHYRFYPIYNGFALERGDIPAETNIADYSVVVRKIEAYHNHQLQLIPAGASIAYGLNNLRVHYGIPHQDQAVYQYQLDPYSSQWSGWTSDRSLEFLNLREGRYTLALRAKANGVLTLVAKVSFVILPPWYRTWLAYAVYLLLLGLLYLGNRRWHRVQLRKQKEKLLEQEQAALRKQAEKYEQETLLIKQQQLEYEKNVLRQQIKQKNIELAKQAKENEDKNRLLHILKEKMDQIPLNAPVSKGHWTEMKRMLDMYLETDDKTFEIQIDELHQDFFSKLRELYPDLSLYDLRLCAYLKIGLNSKEISEIMKVLPSSINVSRSRLRKKLNLQPEQDLYRVLNDLV